MLICPDCHETLDAGEAGCRGCGWRMTEAAGVPVLLSSEDRTGDAFRGYLESYDTVAADDLDQSIQPVEYIAAQAEKMTAYLPPLAGRAVCEIGVGQGHLYRRLLAAAPRSLVGVDIALPYLRELKQRGHHVLLANAENLPFRDAFDVVVATDILEHVFNVGDFLVSVHRALKNDGVFAVRVPFDENLMGYARQRGCKYRYTHLRTFDRHGLKRLLGHAGFSVSRMHYDGFQAGECRRYTRSAPLRQMLNRLLRGRSDATARIAALPNGLALLLFRPLEVVAIARKIAA